MKSKTNMNAKFLTALSALIIITILSLETVSAQNPTFPNASSGQSVVQELGISKITLNYARPNIKGREVFGSLVPYGEVWRTGANNATSLDFSDEVIIAGKTIPAGTYGLFTIPGKDKWTIILNKNPKQWGAYTYDEKDDVLRFEVKPAALPSTLETFGISFSEVTDKKATVTIAWENVAVPFEIHVDQDAKIMANIDEAMKGERKPYMQAAQYYYANDKDLAKALEWMDEALAQNPKATYMHYWKARIQLKAGDKAGARSTAETGKKLAQEAGNNEYVVLNQQVIDSSL